MADVEPIQIPKSLHDDLRHVMLCEDFHYVNGVTVFHSISRKIDYRTVSFPLSRSKASITNELKDIYQLYYLPDDYREERDLSEKYTEKLEKLKLKLIEACDGDIHNGRFSYQSSILKLPDID